MQGKWVFLLLVVAATASGQSIYKCRDAKGGLVYQSDPCPGAEKRWDVQPGARLGTYSPDDRMSKRAANARVERDRRGVQAGNRQAVGAFVAGPSPSFQSTCDAARAQRNAARDAAQTHWTFDDASRWDRVVRNACK